MENILQSKGSKNENNNNFNLSIHNSKHIYKPETNQIIHPSSTNKESPIKIICKDNLNKQNDLQYSIKPKKANAINQSNNSYYSRSKSQIQKQIFDIKSEIIQANNVPQNIIRLKNLGNTSYFNSGLQCILNCQFLTNHLINSKYRIESNNMELVCSFRKLLIDIKDNSSFISPHEVLNEFIFEQIPSLTPKELTRIFERFAVTD